MVRVLVMMAQWRMRLKGWLTVLSSQRLIESVLNCESENCSIRCTVKPVAQRSLHLHSSWVNWHQDPRGDTCLFVEVLVPVEDILNIWTGFMLPSNLMNPATTRKIIPAISSIWRSQSRTESLGRTSIGSPRTSLVLCSPALPTPTTYPPILFTPWPSGCLGSVIPKIFLKED